MWVFLTKTAKSQFVSKNSDLSPAPCLYTVPTLTPKRRATSLTRTSGSLSSRTDLLLVADADLFRPAADAVACSCHLQSRQRALADDIALKLGLLQFSAKR
jgi:hypothetical protein